MYSNTCIWIYRNSSRERVKNHRSREPPVGKQSRADRRKLLIDWRNSWRGKQKARREGAQRPKGREYQRMVLGSLEVYGVTISPGFDHQSILRQGELTTAGDVRAASLVCRMECLTWYLMACVQANSFSFQQLFPECLVGAGPQGSKHKQGQDPGL